MRIRQITHTLAAVCLLVALLGGVSPGAVLAGSPTDSINEATQVLREMAEQRDAAAMSRLLTQAKGIAIFPSVIKAGLMLGGRYGEGLVLKRDAESGTWCGPYFVKIKGLSYGPQFGFQNTALVLVIANDRGMRGFTGDKVTLGGNMTIAAGPVGRHAEASTDVDLEASIYSYSISKGVFAGLSLEGAVIEADAPVNTAYWKTALLADAILARPAVDNRMQELVGEIRQLMAKGK